MWQRIAHPDLLIYLNASFPTCTKRRHLNWAQADYLEQVRRLAHARRHADLVVETDDLPVEAVLDEVVAFLKKVGGGLAPPRPH